MVDALKLNAIDTIYSVAGIPITDLARLAQAKGLRYIGFRHEQAAGNAVAIAGNLTKKPVSIRLADNLHKPWDAPREG